MEKLVIEITGREQYLLEIALNRMAEQLAVENNRKPSYSTESRRREFAALHNKIMYSSLDRI